VVTWSGGAAPWRLARARAAAAVLSVFRKAPRADSAGAFPHYHPARCKHALHGWRAGALARPRLRWITRGPSLCARLALPSWATAWAATLHRNLRRSATPGRNLSTPLPTPARRPLRWQPWRALRAQLGRPWFASPCLCTGANARISPSPALSRTRLACVFTRKHPTGLSLTEGLPPSCRVRLRAHWPLLRPLYCSLRCANQGTRAREFLKTKAKLIESRAAFVALPFLHKWRFCRRLSRPRAGAGAVGRAIKLANIRSPRLMPAHSALLCT